MSDAQDIPADNLSRDGAIELALRLDAWWQRRGARTVEHWVVPETLDADTARKGWGSNRLGTLNRPAIYTVRSNLVNGSPPRRFQAVAMPEGAFRPSRAPAI
jgi:hypothetical protein